jgi:transposase
MKNVVYVGLDVHKSFSVATAINESGELILQRKLRTLSEEFQAFFQKLSKKAKLKIAFEASSMLRKLLKELEAYGEVKVAHPAKVRLIAETKLKSDRTDSLALAKLLRLNELPEVYVARDEDVLKLRALTRERLRLKYDVTRYKIQIRHLLLSNGIIIEGNIFTKDAKEKIRSYCIDEINRRLDFIANLEEEISKINEEIKDCSFKFKGKIEILTSIPGIGLYVACLLIAELVDIERFSRFKKLSCYVGIIPSQYQSSNKIYFGRITKLGNKYVRWALIQSANIAIKRDDKLKAFYERLAKKKGHNKAIVAVAKKLLRIAYALLKRNEMYRSAA